MKKIIIPLLILSMFISGCGSNNINTNTSNNTPEVTVNIPKDDSVNGYRTESISNNSTNEMPDKISVDEVEVDTNKPTVNSSVSSSKDYCANKNSKVFHYSDCGSVSKMNESNKYFADRNTLINEGYKPCGRCKP